MKNCTILYLFIITALIFSPSYAQQGKSDSTFNTFDDGSSGEGFDGNVRVVIENLDETLFVAGDYLNFNGSSATRIIKLTPTGARDSGFTTGTGFNNSVVSGLSTVGNKLLFGGSFTNYNGSTKNYLARLNLDGTLDTTFNTSNVGPNAVVQAIAQFDDGSIVVAGDAITSYNGTVVSNVFKINSSGTLDTTFSANITAGTAGAISKVMIQTDGKILICGSFTSFNGGSTRGIARLNADGTLDTSFGTNLGTSADNNILAMDVQTDGTIILGGAFTSFNGTAVGRIVRLNANGTADTTFNNAKSGFFNGIVQVVRSTTEGIYVAGSFTGDYNGLAASLNRFILLKNNGDLEAGFDAITGLPSSTFYTIVKAIDGQVFIGGSFTSYDLTTRGRLAKVNSNGALDTTFLSSGGVGANNSVLKVIPLSSGKSMIFGSFVTFNGTTVNRVARLNSDGSLDTTFNSSGTGASNIIRTAIQLSDGSFIIGGNFTSYNGTTRNRIAKINANGTLDASFNPNCNSLVYSIVEDQNGKFLVGGNFTTVGGLARNRLVRLNNDGSLDTSFIADVNDIVETIVIEPITNKIGVGGRFTSFNSTAVTRLVRIDSSGALDASFNNENGPDNIVYTLAYQSNGELLVGGSFTTFGGNTRRRFLRLSSDGTLDPSFQSGNAFSNGSVRNIVVQPDDRILIGGDFSSTFTGVDLVSHAVRRQVRLKSDGSYDTIFISVLNNSCFTIAIDTEGRILIGGAFSSINGTARHRVARLLACVNQTSYTSSGWTRGTPDKKFEVTIESDLTASTDVNWCNCSVATGNVLTIDTEKTLTLAFEYFGNGVSKAGKILFLDSASLFQNDVLSINTGAIEYRRISTPMVNYDYTYWTSPVASQNIVALSPLTSSGKYYSFNGSNNNWAGHSGAMIPGAGYIIQVPVPSKWIPYGTLTHSQKVSFKGVPNNGNYSFAVGADQYNLIGNPYPSALSADDFINANSTIISGALYFWTHNTAIALKNGATYGFTSDDYATYTLVGLVVTAVGNLTAEWIDANKNRIVEPGEYVEINGVAGMQTVEWTDDGDLTLETGEWNDLNKNGIANTGEWTDTNKNGIAELPSEWTDNGNEIFETGEWTDANGDKIFDTGEWTDANFDKVLNLGVEDITRKPNGFIAAGQSFFVGNSAAGSFQFTNAMRKVGDNSSFFRMSKTKKGAMIEKNKVWLNLTNANGAFKQLLVGYVTGATNDWDNLYDGPSYDGNKYVDFYSINNSKNLTIQGRVLPFESTDQVPLGYKSVVAGLFDIGIDSRDGALTNQEVWLEDKKTAAIHDLTKGKYSFTAIKGIENDRFVLKFTNKTLGVDENEIENSAVNVYVKNKKIMIVSSADPIENVAICEMSGRVIYTKDKIGTNEYVLLNLASSNQVLIVRITLQNGAISTKKIIF